jgi:hypothetical protein
MRHLQIDEPVGSRVFAFKKVLIFLVEGGLVLDELVDGEDGLKLFEDGVVLVGPEHLDDAFDGKEVFGVELGPVFVEEFSKT